MFVVVVFILFPILLLLWQLSPLLCFSTSYDYCFSFHCLLYYSFSISHSPISFFPFCTYNTTATTTTDDDDDDGNDTVNNLLLLSLLLLSFVVIIVTFIVDDNDNTAAVVVVDDDDNGNIVVAVVVVPIEYNYHHIFILQSHANSFTDVVLAIVGVVGVDYGKVKV